MLTWPGFPPSQDFGDYQDGYYSVQTTEGEQIAQLIAGYIDIILKKVKNCCSWWLWSSPEPSLSPARRDRMDLQAQQKQETGSQLIGVCATLVANISMVSPQKKSKDHFGLEGDEESTMLEDSVSPKK